MRLGSGYLPAAPREGFLLRHLVDLPAPAPSAASAESESALWVRARLAGSAPADLVRIPLPP